MNKTIERPTLYHYDAKTGAFLGTRPARMSPRNPEQPLVPANTTLSEPPEAGEGGVAVFEGGAWSVVEDHRGKTIYTADSPRGKEVREPGPLPEGATTEPPPSTEHKLVNGAWEIDLDKRKSRLQGEVETAYRNALRSFAHADTTWDASDESATLLRDLLNRLANGRGLPRGKALMRLRDTNGQVHDMSAEDLVDLGEAGSDHRDACLDRRIELLAQIAAAEDEADLPDPSQGWP